MADPGRTPRGAALRSRAPRPLQRTASRAIGLARRAVRLARQLHRTAATRRYPVGRSARARRLLRAGLGDCARCLVIGPTWLVRQALPAASLDVVGTSPDQREVTVVSEALGADSLPRRWHHVVVTDVDPPAQRLAAAVSACTPGGVVAVLGSPSGATPRLLGAGTPTATLRARGVHLVLARPPA